MIVAASADGTTVSGVTDSKGNVYTIDRATVTNANSAAARVALASSRLTTALAAGDTITVTYAAATSNVRAVAAAAFSGLLTSGTATDVAASAASATAGTTPSSGATTTTSYATELVIGGFGAASTAAFTPGSGYLAAGSKTASSAGVSLGVHLEWKAALSKAAQTADGTLASASHWVAAAQTYKPTDIVAPGVPGTPVATGGAGVATLSWAASAEAAVRYHLYRGTTSGFTPGAGNEVGQTTLLTYSDNGDGSAFGGLPAGTYYYKTIAEDVDGNQSTATAASAAATVTADAGRPKAALTSPAADQVVSGTITISGTAQDLSGGHTVGYGFDPAGFRKSRTLDGTTTSNYLLGGLIETNNAGTLTLFDVDGPSGDLARYTAAPTTGQTAVSFAYYDAHGDLAAETTTSPTGKTNYTYDPFGAPLQTPAADTTTERFTGRWDKKLDTTTNLIEMGARPYAPTSDASSASILSKADQPTTTTTPAKTPLTDTTSTGGALRRLASGQIAVHVLLRPA